MVLGQYGILCGSSLLSATRVLSAHSNLPRTKGGCRYPFMLETLTATTLHAIMEIVGPLLLAAGLIYGIVFSRRRSGAAKAATEDATKRLYRQGVEQ